ncbi:ethanolamine utilization protein EutN [Vibrio sinensis]|uniref:Ethanolamine utilization protein EutN n=1 Tax=Vibrio sinensis TaxID=2302434 RepID=A0A3A6R2U6_9VIBR|nr:EutN/CcmL family microcompartment protein [Vibrio sinensis]RJX75189.1 ethanolamine utilization protein EutN [Vibrio sinensis]
MLLAKIVGSVVVTQKIDSLAGKKLMLAHKVITSDEGVCNESLVNEEIVAVDMVGCGKGDLVLLSQGTPAQSCFDSNNKGIDYAVIGIVDTVNKY